jgi:hypothetical protein
MLSITCPLCGSPIALRRAFNIANKPFCSRCGWNLGRAQAALDARSSLVTFLPLGVIALAGSFFFLAARQGGANNPVFFFVLPLFLLFACIPIVGYYSTRKAIASAKFAVNPNLALAQPPLDPQLQMLQSMPRPRRVRFRFSANVAGMIMVFAAIGILNAFIFLAASRPPHRSGNDSFAPFIPLLFVIIVFAAVVLMPYFRDKRNLPLLRDGELAFARVVSQRTVQQGKSSYSSIDYEFKTSSGLQIRSTARDLTNSVFEDMTIPVFYDPLNPGKNVTLCATYLKVSTDPL